MQELRFVLIIVGALAIAALLFHGLWTSKKEGKAKFGDKPLGKLNTKSEEPKSAPERGFSADDDFDVVRKERKDPSFQDESDRDADPLFGSDPLVDSYESDSDVPINAETEVEDDIPSFNAIGDQKERALNKFASPIESMNPLDEVIEEIAIPTNVDHAEAGVVNTPEPISEPEMEVIVLNVHAAGDTPFVGTKLFNSMENNDLRYGDMDIFHYHVDASTNSKVLFSVANMMQPGTLKHDDPAQFSTMGISFFMTLPCCGDAEQNFNLLLRTAQQIADDLGGNVLDDGRNLMTPDRLSAYRRQIQEFKTAQPA